MSALDLAALYPDLYPQLVAYLRRRLPPSLADEAEDLASDAVVRMLAAAGYQDLEKPEAWARTIARNLLIDRVRRARLARWRVWDPYLHDRADPDALVDPERTALARESAAAVRAGLQALPARYRRLLVGYHLEGRPLAELMLATDRNTQAAKTRHRRAKDRLRRLLAAGAADPDA